MKNLLKGLGAAVGYIAIYIVITILVVIAGSIAYGIVAGISAIKTDFSLYSIIDNFESFLFGSQMYFSFFAGLMALFIYWLIIIAGKKSVKGRLDLMPVSLQSLSLIVPLGIFFNLFITNLLAVIPIPEHLMQDYAEASSSLQGEVTLAMILAAVIMAPVIEEVLFRGLVFKSLLRGMPLIPALILQACIFGLMHGQIIWICYATVIGIVLGVIKTRYGSLYPCILFHFVFNGWSFVMPLVYELLPDRSHTSIVLLVVSFVIIVFLGIIIFKNTARTIHADYTELPENAHSDEMTGSQAIVEIK